MTTPDIHADCRYWGLTPGQCAGYHARLMSYYYDRAGRMFIRAAEVYGKAQTFARWMFIFWVATAGLAIFVVASGGAT